MKITLKTTRSRLYNGITKYADKSCTDRKKRGEVKLEAAIELFREILGV